ncbi:MAG: HlyC/CorC family transporter [Alphaproteobacteria bacterium]|nr:HlyC/CorC family transporter [Alphaproteobacteria bacterium]
MITTIGFILLLLILSGFFSGSETALTGASRPLMHQLERKGDKKAGIVNQLYEDKNKLIGAILLGNNLVNILASALATSILITLFGEAGVVYATIAMTLLVLIFSEILPKTYAFENADRLALTIAPVIRPIVLILSPITNTLQAIVSLTLKIFGASRGEGDNDKSIEELRGAISLHEGDDVEAIHHERAMLSSVLDLNEVQVVEIMVHRKSIALIDADLPPDEIVDQALASPYTRIPIWREKPDNIIGIIHAKALLRAIRAQDGRLEGLDILSLCVDPWFIPETTTLLDQLQAFRDKHEHFALVVDEYGSIQGIVTLEDILEEIVGDISDEHDILVSGVRQQADGSYIVDGTVTIRDLNRQFDWEIPDEDAATIAGLVLFESRRIPEVGQVFSFHGFRIEILQRQRNQITSIKLAPLTLSQSSEPIPSPQSTDSK